MRRIQLPHIDPATTEREISDFLVDTVLENHATGGVIGLSGGVDSTTVAALAKRAFDRYNTDNAGTLELVGYLLPSKTNDPKDTEDGIRVAERLGIRYEIHSLEPHIEPFRTTHPRTFASQYHKGNLTSRIRGAALNTSGSEENKTVLGTGNKDEDFGIGYYTLFGDGAVHCSPIGPLSKRLVRQMASYLGFDDLANREPTAGLEPGQTDFGDLGYKYDLVELVTEGLEQGFTPEELAVHEQIVPLVERQQIAYATAFGAPKFRNTGEVVADILSRHEIALKKAQIVDSSKPAVTLEYR